MADRFSQQDHRYRFDWGPDGLRRVAATAEAVVVVDVLSFTTAVEVALGGGAIILPAGLATTRDLADGRGAILAADHPQWSLSPNSLREIPTGTRLVLPSPNGSALALEAAGASDATIVAGCLRNRTAVARYVAGLKSVAVIAAGERWADGHGGGSVRPSGEDHVGAGAILAVLPAEGRSPEATAAVGAFESLVSGGLVEHLGASGSGHELTERGRGDDVMFAADLDVSEVVPVLVGDEFVDAQRHGPCRGGGMGE